MSDFDTILKNGIKRIWDEDSEIQNKFLQNIAKVRQMSADLLKQVSAFFIPNDDYLANYCGDVIRKYEYDCYVGLECRWSNWLVIPIYDVAGVIVGLGGFNPFIYLTSKESGNKVLNYYQYSSSRVFEKGKYLYFPEGIFDKALDDGYLFVTDGLFDCINLYGAGFNAASLMGSSITDEIIIMFRFIKRIILVADNDKAGVILYRKLNKRLKNLELFSQGKTKDIDELLCSSNRQRAICCLRDSVINGCFYRIKTQF